MVSPVYSNEMAVEPGGYTLHRRHPRCRGLRKTLRCWVQKVQDVMLAEVQGRCRGCRSGAGSAGAMKGRCRAAQGVQGGAGGLHHLHLGKHNIRCREVQAVQAHLRQNRGALGILSPLRLTNLIMVP